MPYARIENGRVAEIIDFDPAGKFHPDLIWEPCDSGTEEGDVFDGETFSPYVPSAAEATQIRRGEILSRLAIIDRESIRAVRAHGIGRGSQADVDKLNALEDEAISLRAELAALPK